MHKLQIPEIKQIQDEGWKKWRIQNEREKNT